MVSHWVVQSNSFVKIFMVPRKKVGNTGFFLFSVVAILGVDHRHCKNGEEALGAASVAVNTTIYKYVLYLYFGRQMLAIMYYTEVH